MRKGIIAIYIEMFSDIKRKISLKKIQITVSTFLPKTLMVVIR